MAEESFLEKYKWIVGDIVVPVVIGVCSVWVACSANQISRLQAQIAKNSVCPTIEVSAYTSSENSDDIQESFIDVNILDGKYNNYESDIRTFLVLGRWDKLTDSLYNRIEIPVTDYYTKMQRTPQSLYGTVETLRTYQNFIDLRGLMNDLYYEKGFDRSLVIFAESCLQINYTNLLDEIETVYYSINSNGYGSVFRISEEQGKEFFRTWHTISRSNLYISPDSTLAVLFQIVDRIEKENDPYRIIEDFSTIP